MNKIQKRKKLKLVEEVKKSFTDVDFITTHISSPTTHCIEYLLCARLI